MSAPNNFSTFCDMAGLPPNETEEFWTNAQEDTMTDFLTWLIEKAGLEQEQLQKLEEVFNKIKQGQSENVFPEILRLLSNEQKNKIIKKFSEFFIEKLENLYEQIGEKMTIEQKQVANAYIQKAYV